MTTASAWKWFDAWRNANCRLKCVWSISAFVAFDLTYALQDGYETTILVDACPHGEQPGTVYVIEPNLDDCRQWRGPEHRGCAQPESHERDPVGQGNECSDQENVSGRLRTGDPGR